MTTMLTYTWKDRKTA